MEVTYVFLFYPTSVIAAVNFPVFYIYELEGQEIPTETLYTARMTRMSIDVSAKIAQLRYQGRISFAG